MPRELIERAPQAEIAWKRNTKLKKIVAEVLGDDSYIHLGGSGNREWLKEMDLSKGEPSGSPNRWVFRAVPTGKSFHVEPAGHLFRSPPGGVNLTSPKSFLSFMTPVIFGVERDRKGTLTRFEWVPGWEWVSWFLLPEIVSDDDTSAKIGRSRFGKGILTLKGKDYELVDWGVVGPLKPDTKFNWSLLGREVTFNDVGRALLESIVSLNATTNSRSNA